MKNFEPNENFIYYLYWIVERMNIFWKRYNGGLLPYTEDEILRNYKFTNVYRVLDRSSQYLIKNVIQNGKKYSKEDIFWRILLYKHFNLPETWKFLEKGFGDITMKVPFDDIENYLLANKNKLYSNAYIVTCHFYKLEKYFYLKGTPKVHAYFDIYKKAVFNNGYVDVLLSSNSMEELYNNLLKLDIYGEFMSMQYVIDFNYSDLFDFNENDFIVAGVGAKRGIERTFDIKGKPNYQEIIRWVHNNFEQLFEDYGKEFDMDLDFKSLPNWSPTFIDIQNCFCEMDKYMRGIGVKTEGKKVKGIRIKSKFNQNDNKIEYVFPEKWGVKI